MRNTNHVQLINSGYLITACNPTVLRQFTAWDDTHDDHDWKWCEYAMWDDNVYPNSLTHLADAGIAFGWEFVCTEDFSYYAYNFPTKEQKNNLVMFKTGRRKGLPHLTNKLRKELETESSINELLLSIGIKPDGTN